jgi:hypothetical protein
MVNHPNRRRKTAPALAPVHDHDADYAVFLAAVQASFDTVAASGARLFETTAEGLNDAYLAALPAERLVHTCSACRHFIERFGGLVAIGDDGDTVPAMWSGNVPTFYWSAVIAMGTLAQRARITGPFLASDATWGTPLTRDRAAGKVWEHLSVQVPVALRFRERLLTPGQAMAAKREDFATVARALSEFTPGMLDEALRLLETESLYRSERFMAPVKWLRALHDRPKGRQGENLLWRAIATAPDGFCHPRASVVGTLLEDIAGGLPFGDIKARFDAKMHPLRYQRPQAAPSAGTIAQAEAVFAKMGIERALERRFARLDECETLWRPKDAPPPSTSGGGVFGHLKPKGHLPPPTVDIPPVTMTWDKFRRAVLGTAEAMEMLVPAHGNFMALTAAVHPDAPPIYKWDRDERRNAVDWYVYHGGSAVAQWRLTTGWHKVAGIVPKPEQWGDKPTDYLGNGVVIILDGAADTRTGQGNAIFPESLRAELHGVRSVIEAYSHSAALSGVDQASACGYGMHKGVIDVTLRALSNGRWTAYRIDRWD